jgi:hypothetical protein
MESHDHTASQRRHPEEPVMVTRILVVKDYGEKGLWWYCMEHYGCAMDFSTFLDVENRVEN